MLFIQTFLYTEMNIFALIVLALIYLNITHRMDRFLPEEKLFITVIGLNALILVLDTGMWLLDGRPGSALRVILLLITAAYYVLNPVICIVWSFYADFLVYGSKKRLRRLLLPMAVPALLNFCLSVTSMFNGWMFYLDDGNVYHRGPLFLVMVAVSYLYLAYTMIFIIRMRYRVKQHHYIPMLVFALPPFLAGLLQTMFYGLSLIWVSVTISILIVFINIQNYQMYTDYLTGLFNRRQLDLFLQQLQSGGEDRRMAGLMIDLDSFKQINDLYGHVAGDEALRQTAQILRKTFRRSDFIARYGGDEFVVIMELRKHITLDKVVLRLRENAAQFNRESSAPYTISLSIGCDTYNPSACESVQGFLMRLDNLMYQDKQRNSLSRRKPEGPATIQYTLTSSQARPDTAASSD